MQATARESAATVAGYLKWPALIEFSRTINKSVIVWLRKVCKILNSHDNIVSNFWLEEFLFSLIKK